MGDIVRDSLVGQFTRFITGKKIFKYPEEQSPDGYQQYIEKPEKARPRIQRRTTTGLEDPRNTKDNEDYGLLTLTSQVTRISRVRSDATADAEKKGNQSESTLGKTLTDNDPDVHIIGWSGPSDPDNPLNWSFWKKIAVSVQICFMTFAVYVGAGIYSPAIPGITQDFHVSAVAAALGLTTFIGGYGIGPMIFAPLGEAPPIGRDIIYIVGLTVFVVFQLGVTLADNFGMLLAFRFLTGFFGSPVLATGGASMSDMWHPSVVSYAIGVWGAVAICGPTLGPLLGGFAAMNEGWRWPIWILMWASGLSLAINVFFLPETSAATILFRRAQRIRKITGNTNLRSYAEIEAAKVAKKDLLFEAIARPFQLCFTEPVIFVINIYIALIYGILYLFFEAFPIVFEGIYHFSLGQSGIAWLGIFVGASFVGTGLYFVWIVKVRNKKVTPQGLKAEEHLPPAMLGGIIITISMIWFGWVARESIYWMVPIIATGFFGAGCTWLINSAFNYLLSSYPMYAASALASNDFVRSMVAAGFPLFGAATFNNLGVGWACTMLGLLTAVFIPAPFLFYRFGGKLRKFSKRANHEMLD